MQAIVSSRRVVLTARLLLLGPCGAAVLGTLGRCAGALLGWAGCGGCGDFCQCHSPLVAYSVLPGADSAGASGWRG